MTPEELEALIAEIEGVRDVDETDNSLAGRLGIDAKTLRRWKSGQRPSAATLDRVIPRLRAAQAASTHRPETGATAPRSGPPGKGARRMTWEQEAMIVMIQHMQDPATIRDSYDSLHKIMTGTRDENPTLADGGAAPSRAGNFREAPTPDRRRGRNEDTGERRRAGDR